MGVWSRQGVWRFCEVEEGRICSVDPDQIHQHDYAFTRLGRLFPCCASLSLLFPKKIFFLFRLGLFPCLALHGDAR